MLRAATAIDRDAIFALLTECPDEFGFGKVDRDEAMTTIDADITAERVIVADDASGMFASLSLYSTQPWWSRETVLMDRWLYVRPASRNYWVFGEIVAAARRMGQVTNARVILGLTTTKEAERKEMLFGRHGEQILKGYMFTPVGGQFLIA